MTQVSQVSPPQPAPAPPRSTLPAAEVSGTAAKIAVIEAAVLEPLGGMGKALTAYHVGDFTGILGLLISFFGLWWTFKEARQAKRASLAAQGAAEQAREAAQSALRDRDRIEVASTLVELSARLRELRDLSQTDDWTALGMRFDAAVTLTLRIAASAPNLEKDELVAVETIRVELRRTQTEILGVKDATKRQAQKRKIFSALMGMVDSVEAAQTKRIKNGTG